MKELALKYGCNPNQKPSRIYMNEGELPVEVLNGNRVTLIFLMRSTHGSLCVSLRRQQACRQLRLSSM